MIKRVKLNTQLKLSIYLKLIIMKFLKKLGIICVIAFAATACNTESDVNELDESSVSTSVFSKDKPDVSAPFPLWFGEELIYYYNYTPADSNESIKMVGEASNYEWTECGGLGSNCVFAFGGCITSEPQTSSTGTKVTATLRNVGNVKKLEIKLLEKHISHQSFFSDLDQNETNVAAFDELLNFVNFKDDARIIDNAIINAFHLDTNMIIIPAGRYRIDYSNSQYGTILFPIQQLNF